MVFASPGVIFVLRSNKRVRCCLSKFQYPRSNCCVHVWTWHLPPLGPPFQQASHPVIDCQLTVGDAIFRAIVTCGTAPQKVFRPSPGLQSLLLHYGLQFWAKRTMFVLFQHAALSRCLSAEVLHLASPVHDILHNRV